MIKNENDSRANGTSKTVSRTPRSRFFASFIKIFKTKSKATAVVALLVGAIFLTIYLLYIQNNTTWRDDLKPGTTVISANEACHRNQSTKICIYVTPVSLTTSGVITITTTITNVSSASYSTSFSCTYTEPAIFVNDSQHDSEEIRLCGQAITEVELQPGDSERYIQHVGAKQLGPGKHTIGTAWGDNASPNIAITITEAAQSAPAH